MMVCSPTSRRGLRDHLGGDIKAPLRYGLRGGFRRGADDRGRAVHGEIHPRLNGGGGNQRHDGDKRFHQHGPIADEAGIASRS